MILICVVCVFVVNFFILFNVDSFTRENNLYSVFCILV